MPIPNGAPHLIRIETRAGHGSGKPTDKQIEEFSDMYAFIARFTGLAAVAQRDLAGLTWCGSLVSRRSA